jgi:hypothetical protein
MASLLDSFQSLDDGLKEKLADISSPRTLSFLALRLAQERNNVDRLTAEHIVACLESAGVAVKKVAISRALANAGDFVSVTRNIDGESSYKLMTKGKRVVDKLLTNDCLSVVKIEQNHPRTARIELKNILGNLNGLIRICDPYYGIRTFDSLDSIPNSCVVKFLTQKTSESERRLLGALSDFKKERPKCEFRLVDSSAGIHDRFLVTDSELLLLGHGLKDIGGKESFLIKLDNSLIPDLVKEIIASFDKRWTSAKLLI